MSTRLFVGNLSFHVTEDLIKTRFGQIGEVVNATVVTDRETGRSRGFAFVEMGSEAAAQKAIADLDGTDLEGRALRVSVAQERQSRGGGGGGGYGGGGGGGGYGGGGGGGDRGDRGGDRGKRRGRW